MRTHSRRSSISCDLASLARMAITQGVSMFSYESVRKILSTTAAQQERLLSNCKNQKITIPIGTCYGSFVEHLSVCCCGITISSSAIPKKSDVVKQQNFVHLSVSFYFFLQVRNNKILKYVQ